MADYTHTIDRWDDATGENLIEQIAAVGDFLVALETYHAAVKRGPRTRSRCATGRGLSRSRGRTSRSSALLHGSEACSRKEFIDELADNLEARSDRYTHQSGPGIIALF